MPDCTPEADFSVPDASPAAFADWLAEVLRRTRRPLTRDGLAVAEYAHDLAISRDAYRRLFLAALAQIATQRARIRTLEEARRP
jgi:hypothetical protein